MILLRETSNEVPDFFQVGETNHRFRVVKIWEVEPEILMANEHLLPFAVLAKAAKKVTILEKVAEMVKQIENTEKRRELLTQTEILAGLRFPKELAKQLLYEDMMKESVTYQAIVEEGIDIGIKKGVEIGVQQVKEQIANNVIDITQHRFGKVDAKTQVRVKQLSFVELEKLAKDSWKFLSKEDLKIWLNKHK